MTNTFIPTAAVATRALGGQGQSHAAFIASLCIPFLSSGAGLGSAIPTPLVSSRRVPVTLFGQSKEISDFT